ncbi:MAG TPA: hypothetical protein VLJ38_16880 [Polyangiaceae bacterium]|nr:hypothetical protein [Polyangiaceae bacterium]
MPWANSYVIARGRRAIALGRELWRVGALPLLGVALLGACGGAGGAGDDDAANVSHSDPTAAVRETRPPFELGAQSAFYRLDLTRAADGTLSASGVELIDSAQYPLPSLSAEYLAVGYAGNTVVSAVPLAFPETAIRVGFSAGVPVHQTLELTDSTATVFVKADASLDRIAVVASSGQLALELRAADLPERTAQSHWGVQAAEAPTGRSQEPISREQLAFRYAHIRFLTAGDDKVLPAALLSGGFVISPTSTMNDTIADGIAKLAPALLSSVQMLAVVRFPQGSTEATSVLGQALGAQLVLNADMMQDPEMPLTIVHEITHSFTFLSEAAATSNTKDLSAWPVDVRNFALELVKRFRLVKGLPDVWSELHDSGVKAGYASPYTGNGNAWMSLTDLAARAGGFASPYGSTSEWEDMAEYVGSTQAPTATTPGICPSFAGGGQVTPDVSIPYAKLVLLLGLGAITEASFNTCVQGKTIQQQSGIDFPGAITFNSGLKSGYLAQDDGSTSYGILGSGRDSYQLLVEVSLDSKDASPLGLHRLDSIWLGNVGTPGLSAAYLGNDDTLLARAGERGLVLFTEANAQRTAGAIFGLVLQNAAAVNTDYLPFGTFQIP